MEIKIVTIHYWKIFALPHLGQKYVKMHKSITDKRGTKMAAGICDLGKLKS